MGTIVNASEIPYSPAMQAMFKIDPFHLEQRWKKNHSEFHKLMAIANEKQVDISQQVNKMQQIINDRPLPYAPHQFSHVRVLYEIKMYERYTKEIGRKIAQNGLFHQNQATLLEELRWQAIMVDFAFQKWVQIAFAKNIDITQQLDQIQQVHADDLSISEPHQFSSIRILYEIKMKYVFCNQIIRKTAEYEIQQRAEMARNHPLLQNKIDLINACEKFLLKHLPPEISILPIEHAERQYDFITEKMENMTHTLLKKHKI